MTTTEFTGFPGECLRFFTQLSRNNNRTWFEAHRQEYEEYVLDPARLFISAMGKRLRAIAPNIVADPRIDKGIFRIHRDTRFSKDKSPYKTHLAIFMWEGEGKKLDCPGFYFQLEPKSLVIGGGIYIFNKNQLAAYRRTVDDDRRGGELVKILETARRHFPVPMQSGMYKKVPRGYPPDHPRAELLKHQGLTVGEETPVPTSVHSARCLDYVYKRFEKMAGLQRWLREMG
jgi:uncharacterized protein (TIGR02453 family)